MAKPPLFLMCCAKDLAMPCKRILHWRLHIHAHWRTPADALLTVKSADELADAMQLIWQQELPYYILGGGSNVLVSDEGFRGVVVLDRAKTVF